MPNIIYLLSTVNLQNFSKLFVGKAGIYRWTNLENGKSYVGSSSKLGRRVGEYLNSARLTMELLRGESIIYRAMLKYGYSSFSFEVLEFVELDDSLSDKEKDTILQDREQYYLDELQPEYNILKLAGSNRGHTMSAEAREKISQAKKGQPSHRKGTTMSEESRAQMMANSAMKKAVNMYSLDGKLLNTYNSIKDCAKATEFSRFQIGRSIKSGSKSSGFFFTNAPLDKPSDS